MCYFLLSHAHTNDAEDLVLQLFEDLSARVREATGRDRRQPVGRHTRCDRRLVGRHATQIEEALATCRVLVPLYSPRYFASPECGRVVSAFVNRSPVPAADRPSPPCCGPRRCGRGRPCRHSPSRSRASGTAPGSST